MVEPSAIIHASMNTLLWEAAIMTVCIGCVDLGWGKNDPRDLGIVLLAGALLETIALCFVLANGNALDATIAAAFILALWYLGFAMTLGKTNRLVMVHANMLTGLLFFLFTVWAAINAHVFLAIALGLLVPVLWGGSLAHYTGNPKGAKIAGIAAFVDSFVFTFMAFCGAIGVNLP